MNITLIANPASGNYNKQLLDRCAEILRNRLGNVSVVYTTAPNEAGVIAGELGKDMVIAAGGDGLINEIAAGLVGKNVLFSALPFGTVNVFCREFKIPLNPVKAAERLNPDKLKTIPLGFLGDRPFTLMCGFGYDANVVKSVVTKKYKKYKTLAHIAEGFASLKAKYPKLTLHIHGKTFPAYHVIISLGELYAGNFSLSNAIKDNKLNIFVQPSGLTKSLVYSTFSIIVGGGFPMPPIHADVAKIVGTNHAQIDGEYIDTNVMQNYIKIKKSALTVAL